MDYDFDYFDGIVREAEPYHEAWLDDAKIDTKYYRGDQWPEGIKDELEEQMRPALTLNVIRPLVRLLTGIERKSRYDMKMFPVSGDDHTVARMFTKVSKTVEYNNNGQYIYSEAYKNGLVCGRGWVQTDLKYDRNTKGDIVLREIDPFEMMVDPYSRRYDLEDARYIVRKIHWTEPEVAEYYPQFLNKMDKLQPSSMDTATQYTQLPTYLLYEIWYKRWEERWVLIDKTTGERLFIPTAVVEKVRKDFESSETLDIVKYLTSRVHYAVLSSGQIIEEGESPFYHNMFPYAPFFAEFVPQFGDIAPDWLGIVRDLRDPQDEKNKRRSEYLDILVRVVNTGYRYEDGSVVNSEVLKDAGKQPGFEIIMARNKFPNFEFVRSDAPNPQLLQLDVMADNDVNKISGIHPPMMGYAEGSRESGRSVMLRQQQGHAMLTPYQDNMRITRTMTSRQVLALIQQVYGPERILRIIQDSQTAQKEQQENAIAIQRMREDWTLGRYDVMLSDTPSTPTMRQAEFLELMEMVQAQVLPPTPGIAKFIIQSSDLSLKNEIVEILDEEFRKAQEAQTQQQMMGGQ